VLAGLALAAPALAVGLGPLTKTGITDGPDKGFYLTLYNPYKQRVPFTVYAVGAADEIPQDRVRVPLKPIPLNAESARKFMIVAGQLAPGETYAFRVCAERFTAKEEPIHARVCSRITARRVGGGA
jgi:hypothetical protein